MKKKDAVEFHTGKIPLSSPNSSCWYESKIFNGFLTVLYLCRGVDGFVSGGEVFIDDDGTHPEYKIFTPTLED